MIFLSSAKTKLSLDREPAPQNGFQNNIHTKTHWFELQRKYYELGRRENRGNQPFD